MANNVTEPDLGSQLVVPGGLIYFDRWDSDDEETGFIHLGESDSFVINITGDTLTRNTRTTTARDQIKFVQVNVTRNATITVLSVTNDAMSLFMTADESTVTQSATPVTEEEIEHVNEDRIYYLGRSSSNPVGIMAATSVAIRNHDSTKAAWAGSTAYAVGDNVEKVIDDGTVFRCKVAHTSHASTEPTWSTTTVASHNVEGSLSDDAGGTTGVWEYIASANTTFVAGTDYELDDTAATGARFRWISTTTFGYVYCDYTPTSNSRTRLATSDTIRATGTLRVVTANQGTDSIWHFPKVQLVSEGDFELVNDGSAFQTISFQAGIEKSGSLSAIYRDGIAA